MNSNETGKKEIYEIQKKVPICLKNDLIEKLRIRIDYSLNVA